MALRDDVHDALAAPILATKAGQAFAEKGEQGILDGGFSNEEVLAVLRGLTAGNRAALMLLADEIEALKDAH
jgi:hypothetical protein